MSMHKVADSNQMPPQCKWMDDRLTRVERVQQELVHKQLVQENSIAQLKDWTANFELRVIKEFTTLSSAIGRVEASIVTLIDAMEMDDGRDSNSDWELNEPTMPGKTGDPTAEELRGSVPDGVATGHSAESRASTWAARARFARRETHREAQKAARLAAENAALQARLEERERQDLHEQQQAERRQKQKADLMVAQSEFSIKKWKIWAAVAAGAFGVAVTAFQVMQAIFSK